MTSRLQARRRRQHLKAHTAGCDRHSKAAAHEQKQGRKTAERAQVKQLKQKRRQEWKKPT